MLEKVVIIVLVENGLIPSELWTLALETYFGGTRKKLRTTVFCSSKTIVISEASINGI